MFTPLALVLAAAAQEPSQQELQGVAGAHGYGFIALWSESVRDDARLWFARIDEKGAQREPATAGSSLLNIK